MNNMHIRTGLLFGSLLVGFTQSALSATLTFFDSTGGEGLPCGNVANLTVTSTAVTATGTLACLVDAPDDGTPTAFTHLPLSVDTGEAVSKNLTDDARVVLPLKAVKVVSGPSLNGARVTIDESTGEASYVAPSAADISASDIDYFAYTIKDDTDNTSASATVTVNVNWVAPMDDGCTPASDIVCKGPTPGWPTFHEAIDHQLGGNTTHVWSFVYEQPITGQIGTVASQGDKHRKISPTAGDTTVADVDCWRFTTGYVYYEPENGGNSYSCNLEVGKRYYFNIKNIDSTPTTYQLKGY